MKSLAAGGCVAAVVALVACGSAGPSRPPDQTSALGLEAVASLIPGPMDAAHQCLAAGLIYMMNIAPKLAAGTDYAPAIDRAIAEFGPASLTVAAIRRAATDPAIGSWEKAHYFAADADHRTAPGLMFDLKDTCGI